MVKNADTIDISIITIVYNDARGLRKTLESALKQKKVRFEIIVVDGASTDGSPSIARTMLRNCGNAAIISEKDDGLYDALNKGIKKARGKYINILNAGDWLYDDMSRCFLFSEAEKSRQGCALGRCKYYYAMQGITREDTETLPSSGAPEICHQALLYPKSFHDSAGYYNEKIKSAADYDFFMRLVRRGVSFDKKDRFVVMRGKYGSDSSESLRNTVEMMMIDFKTGLWKRTMAKRTRSLLVRLIRAVINRFLFLQRPKNNLKLLW